MSGGQGFGSFFHEMGKGMSTLAQQGKMLGANDTITHKTDIQDVGTSDSKGGGDLAKVLRRKVLDKMPKKVVEQKGGRMVGNVSVGGKKYKCEATKVGKHCRYEIRPIGLKN